MSSTTKTTESSDCQRLHTILSTVGDKWSVIVMMSLADGPKRFNELKRQIVGISQRMLTVCLRNLERDGLVLRTDFAEIPLRVEYELTALGKSLRIPIFEIGAWARANGHLIESARLDFGLVD